MDVAMKNSVYALILIALSGCASIVNDNPQTIKITASNGQEIKGIVEKDTLTTTKNGKKTVKTHTKSTESDFQGTANNVWMKRSSATKTIVVENPECEKETPVESYLSPAFFGNILIGGLIGSTIDLGTQKMWQYHKNIVINCQ